MEAQNTVSRDVWAVSQIVLLLLICLPLQISAASYSHSSAIKVFNGDIDHSEYDSDSFGGPVHVYVPDSALGLGSEIQSAAAVTSGVADDGTFVSPLTLKTYASIGAISATTDQIELYSRARYDTPFEITAPGTQTISVAWYGRLHATGNGVAQYFLNLGFNPWNGVYTELNEAETVNEYIPGNVSSTDSIINETRTLEFDFEFSDVGDVYNLQAYLTSYAAIAYGGGTTAGSYSDFYDSFVVTGWSGGLRSIDGIDPIPIPSAAWLFVSALGVFGYLAKRKANV